jgi:hypothetical protein
MREMIPSIKPWISQAQAYGLMREAAVYIAKLEVERDMLQRALDVATARMIELLNERDENRLARPAP